MRSEILDLLDEHGGVADRRELVRVAGRTYTDYLVEHRHLERMFPRVYALPWDAELPAVRDRAALMSVGGDAALSHVTALRRRGLPAPEGPLHVTAYNPRHPRGIPGELVVHRTRLPLRAQEWDGLPVVAPAVAAVTSWPLLSGSDAAAPLIEAWRRRMITAPALSAAVRSAHRQRGIAAVRELAAALLAGCESQLELYGYVSVFDVDGLRDARRQVGVCVDGRRYRLDMLYDDAALVVELDGRRYHAGTEQWERDIARDLALAKAGLQTVRLSHARLSGDVDGVRRDVLAIRALRQGCTATATVAA